VIRRSGVCRCCAHSKFCRLSQDRAAGVCYCLGSLIIFLPAPVRGLFTIHNHKKEKREKVVIFTSKQMQMLLRILPFLSSSVVASLSRREQQYQTQQQNNHQQNVNLSFPLPPQLCIALVFLLIDSLKFVLREKTGALWRLQRRIKTLNNTIGEEDETRKEELRRKEKELLSKRTPLMRKLMSFGHYLSWLKFLISSAFIKLFFGVPLFEVPRAIVWPMGRFLAFPHGNTFEFGQIAVIPWVCLSSVCSVQLTNVLLGPFIITSSKTLVLFGGSRRRRSSSLSSRTSRRVY